MTPNIKTHGHKAEVEGQGVTLEESAKQRQVLEHHITTTVLRMRKIEDEVMDNPMMSQAMFNDKYQQQEKLSRQLQWLKGIEFNRFLEPERMAKIKADQESAGKMKIVAP